MEILLAVIIGFILDLIFGDPLWLPHPIRLLGFLISKGELFIRKLFPKTNKGEFAGGIILAAAIIAIAFIVPFWMQRYPCLKLHSFQMFRFRMGT